MFFETLLHEVFCPGNINTFLKSFERYIPVRETQQDTEEFVHHPFFI